MTQDDGHDSVTKEDRKERVLRYLVSCDSALPPAAIFRNVKFRGADFERRSVDNYLNELVEEGYARKVDPQALEDGEIVEVDLSETGYFIATEVAEERLS